MDVLVLDDGPPTVASMNKLAAKSRFHEAIVRARALPAGRLDVLLAEPRSLQLPLASAAGTAQPQPSQKQEGPDSQA